VPLSSPRLLTPLPGGGRGRALPSGVPHANSDGRGRAGGRRPLPVVFSVEVGSGKWGIEEDNKGMVDLDGSERAEMWR
jgi:hypothetical protein